jgi:hypothetical protein
MSFQFAEGLGPWVPYVNQQINAIQQQSFAALYAQELQGYQGDPLSGTVVPGTTINVDNLTECQYWILVYYIGTQAMQGLPSDIAAILSAAEFAGPPATANSNAWNATNAQWGFGPFGNLIFGLLRGGPVPGTTQVVAWAIIPPTA